MDANGLLGDAQELSRALLDILDWTYSIESKVFGTSSERDERLKQFNGLDLTSLVEHSLAAAIKVRCQLMTINDRLGYY